MFFPPFIIYIFIMKNLDVISKPHNFYTKKTLYGGLATVLIFVIFVFLLIKEYNNFNTVKIDKNLYLDPNPN